MFTCITAPDETCQQRSLLSAHLEDSNGIWVGCATHDNHDAVPVQVGHGDVIQMGVGPVDLLMLFIDGDAVGPVDIATARHDLRYTLTIQGGTLDTRFGGRPVCPEHIPILR